MTKNSEETTKFSDKEIQQVLERLRIAVPRIENLTIAEGVATIAVPPFDSKPNDSLRQRAVAAETGLSGGELATLNYLLTTDKKILDITGGVELTLKTQRV